MRSSTSLWGRTLLWIASEMLEILTKIFRIIFKSLNFSLTSLTSLNFPTCESSGILKENVLESQGTYRNV